MNSKYRMFKNYMYNDLGITKDDIRQWTKEAVKEVAQNYLEHHVDDMRWKLWIREEMYNNVCRIAPKIIAEEIIKHYNISVDKR